MDVLGGRYRLGREVGSGGIGHVYEAVDEKQYRTVAVKLIGCPAGVDSEIASRLADQTAMFTELHHPNIVQIYETIVEVHRIAVVMDFLPGSSLLELIHAGVQLADLQRILWQVAGGLEYLHEHGIIHGDIKASNIMCLPAGEAKSLDLEVAMLGAAAGTPAYMSPEQVKGRPLDRRSDIYSLGAVLQLSVRENPRFEWQDPGQMISEYRRELAPPTFGRPAAPSPPMAFSKAAESIQLSAHYPKEVAVGSWYPLYAYVFRPAAAAEVAADAANELGSRLQNYRERAETARQQVVEGSMISAMPRLEGFQFNPPVVTISFFEDWRRLDFRLRASGKETDRSFNGSLTFTIEGVIIADIPLSIFVGTEFPVVQPVSSSRRPYDAIFCSYSHGDEAIVRRVERAYRALGMEYLRDLTTLKSGQSWNDELLRTIERSDIFQLFWSANAARSECVAREWRHALQLGRDVTSFVRPVYWQRPMPSPPPELGRLHFAYDSGLHDEQPDVEERRGWRPWRR